ncbi:MAG: SH3 domain-containing protein [Alphaproteobacteria bacterium]|nr:SH3 domain-containing protein [Alphaproteobacteria bacterium]
MLHVYRSIVSMFSGISTVGHFRLGRRMDQLTLNLRSVPSGNSKVRQTLPLGAVLAILERRGKWLHVQLLTNGRKGLDGWVAQRFTKQIEKSAQCLKFVPDDTGSTTGTGGGTDDQPCHAISAVDRPPTTLGGIESHEHVPREQRPQGAGKPARFPLGFFMYR